MAAAYEGPEGSVFGRKIVALGLPWDMDTDDLREYMAHYGDIDDLIVMKDRLTGRSRGFGYVTFSDASDAEKVVSMSHTIGDRKVEVKMATPKEDMAKGGGNQSGVTRVFAARIAPHIDDEMFRRHFEQYGEIIDCYMPRDPQTLRGHRGIGFITYQSADSVEKAVQDTHIIEGCELAVDRARAKEEMFNPRGRPGPSFGGYGPPGGSYAPHQTQQYGSSDSYDSRPPGTYDTYRGAGAAGPASQEYGRGARSPGHLGIKRPGNEAKIFVGKLPQQATTHDLRDYFGQFGPLEDVYLPKDPSRESHRGFAFITFTDPALAAYVSNQQHNLCGFPVAVDRAIDGGPRGGSGRGGGYYGGGPVRRGGGDAGNNYAGGYAGGSYQDSYNAAPEYGQYGGYTEYAPPGTTDVEPSYRSNRSEAGRFRPY